MAGLGGGAYAAPPPARMPMPGAGHIAGPVSGIARGYAAMMNKQRQRPRRTHDSSAAYITWTEARPFTKDPRDALALEPTIEYAKMVRVSA